MHEGREITFPVTCILTLSNNKNQSCSPLFYPLTGEQGLVQPLRYLAQNPFFLEDSFSDTDRVGRDPIEKCRLKKGLPKELFMLELAPILGLFSLLFRRSERGSVSTSMSATAILEILLLPFNSVFPDSFAVDFSPWVQTGQGGSYLSVSGVMFSKQSAWYTCPQTRTATTENSFVDIIFWVLHGDLSFNSFEHTLHVCRSGERDVACWVFDLAILLLLEPTFSLSNDHCSRWEATSSENVRMDQPSEDPPWDPPVDKSLLQTESTKDSLSSGELFSFRDWRDGILLSETCLESWYPGERCAFLDEAGSEGREWLLEDEGSAWNADDGLIGTEIEGLASEALAMPGDSIEFFSCTRYAKALTSTESMHDGHHHWEAYQQILNEVQSQTHLRRWIASNKLICNTNEPVRWEQQK